MEASANRSKGDGVSTQKKYEQIQAEYSRLTGHLLIIADEKKARTLPMREQDLLWMNNMRASNPNIRFRFDVNANRPFALQEDLSQFSNVQQVQPQPQLPIVQPNPSPLYSSNPISVKQTLQPTDVQRHMRNVPAYPTATRVSPPPVLDNLNNSHNAQQGATFQSVPNIPPLSPVRQQTPQTDIRLQVVDAGRDAGDDDESPPDDEEFR